MTVITETYTQQVAAENMVWEDADGDVLVADAEVHLTQLQYLGMLFTGLTIPRLAVVTAAHLTTRSSAGTTGGDAEIRLIGTVAAAPWVVGVDTYDVTKRQTLSRLGEWPAFGFGTNVWKSPSFHEVLQALVVDYIIRGATIALCLHPVTAGEICFDVTSLYPILEITYKADTKLKTVNVW